MQARIGSRPLTDRRRGRCAAVMPHGQPLESGAPRECRPRMNLPERPAAFAVSKRDWRATSISVLALLD